MAPLPLFPPVLIRATQCAALDCVVLTCLSGGILSIDESPSCSDFLLGTLFINIRTTGSREAGIRTGGRSGANGEELEKGLVSFE